MSLRFMFCAFAVVLGSHATAAGITPLKDLTYKVVNDVSLKLDLYLPEKTAARTPLMLVVHGGGWVADSKADSAGMATQFAQHGYAAAAIDYRLWPVAVFPAQIEDVKAAVRWLREHADEYHLDANRIGAIGHSAGGHLVSLLGTSSDITQFDVGENVERSSKVEAVVDMAGPVDLVAYFSSKGVGKIGLLGGTLAEKKDLAALGSPASHIGAGTPPFLMISGQNDDKVGVDAPKAFLVALQKANVPAQLILLPDVGHGIPLRGPYDGQTVFDAIWRFLDPILKPAAGA